MSEPEIMTILRYISLGMTGYKIAMPGVVTLSGFLMMLLSEGGSFTDRIELMWQLFNTHLIYRHVTRYKIAMDPKNFWLYSCSSGNCTFNTDEAIRLFMLFIYFPSVIILYIVQLAMIVASYVTDGFLIYMLTLPFNWQYTLARNGDKKT